MTRRTTWFGPESSGMTLAEIAGGQEHMDMQPINPSQPLTVTLSAQKWNAVMSAAGSDNLVLGPSLFNEVGQQLQQQTQPQQMPKMPMSRGNEVGLDRLRAESDG